MDLEDCLPPELRGPETVIAPIAMGFSGASVYRVDAAGGSFALKLARDNEVDVEWRHALQIQRAAADVGLTPRVVHVDEARRAVVTDFVVDRVFPARYLDPRTHQQALAELGHMVRRIHALPISSDVAPRDQRRLLAQLSSELQSGYPIPTFGRQAIEGALAAAVPAEAPLVLGHNDLNPSNLIYDGQSLLVLDWSTAGRCDRFVDLATLAVFLRMDDPTCLRLLAAYEDADPRDALPDRFIYMRRLIAALVGAMMLDLARRAGYPGAASDETLASTLSLAEFYQAMRAGTADPATPHGQWTFGKALLKESLR